VTAIRDEAGYTGVILSGDLSRKSASDARSGGRAARCAPDGRRVDFGGAAVRTESVWQI